MRLEIVMVLPLPRSIVCYVKPFLFCTVIAATFYACSEAPDEHLSNLPLKTDRDLTADSSELSEALLPEAPTEETVLIERTLQPFQGDLPQIRKRRMIRALVSYSKTNYFLDAGMPRGFEYEMLRNYEKYLNRSVKKTYNKMKVFFIPVPFDQLLPALAEGLGDIAAAGLTITLERQQTVMFTHPYIPAVSEVVVRHKSVFDLNTLEDLAGRTLYVRPQSSYVTHLKRLNSRFEASHLDPVTILEADSILGTEDILEMVNAGIVDVTVADHHIAEAWSQVLPDIRVDNHIEINSGGLIAWAVRKNNPELLRSLNAFIKKRKKGSLLGNILFKRYYQQAKWIKNPLSEKGQKNLEGLMRLFRKYSGQYGYDWLAVVAQAYQESELDHRKTSPAGAVGIMQLLPSTASGPPIYIHQIERIDNNIHAGVKYLDFLRGRYYSDPAIPPDAQVDFAWAAYNAGPARINGLRKIAAQRGLDPNRWFANVERIAAEKIGHETVSYVANINKYYIAYKLYRNKIMARDKTLQSLGVNSVTQLAQSKVITTVGLEN